MSTDNTRREFNFVACLTALVVVMYMGASIYALVKEIVKWQEFAGAVGPVAGLLLGRWSEREK